MRLFIENEIQQCKEDFWRNFLEYALEKYLQNPVKGAQFFEDLVLDIAEENLDKLR